MWDIEFKEGYFQLAFRDNVGSITTILLVPAFKESDAMHLLDALNISACFPLIEGS